jgi:hypothetical protein
MSADNDQEAERVTLSNKGLMVLGMISTEEVDSMPRVRGGFRSPHAQAGRVYLALPLPRPAAPHWLRHEGAAG